MMALLGFILGLWLLIALALAVIVAVRDELRLDPTWIDHFCNGVAALPLLIGLVIVKVAAWGGRALMRRAEAVAYD